MTHRKIRAVVELPQALADAHTLIAQKYAGCFVGHPYRAAQQRVGPDAIRVDAAKAWQEPLVTADDCEFCRRLTDDEAERRVMGYQHAIDIEVLRPHALAYATWLGSGARRDEQARDVLKPRSQNSSASDRRTFIESHREILQVQPYPVIELPLRLKRKMCIEWNHLYRDFLRANPGVAYDSDKREFYREVDEPERMRDTTDDWWQGFVPGARSRR